MSDAETAGIHSTDFTIELYYGFHLRNILGGVGNNTPIENGCSLVTRAINVEKGYQVFTLHTG